MHGHHAPPHAAGVGSAANDTVRELGGALGGRDRQRGRVALPVRAEGQLSQLLDVPEHVCAVVSDNGSAAAGMGTELGAAGLSPPSPGMPW